MTPDNKQQAANFFSKYQNWYNEQLCEVFVKNVFTVKKYGSASMKYR